MIAVETPKQIRDRVMADIESRLDSDTPLLALGLLNIVAWIVAGVAFAIYSLIALVAARALPGAAELDPDVVDGWGFALDVPRLAAVAASGAVNFEGDDDTVIAAGTIWVSPTGIEYSVDADVTIVDGEASGDVTATTAGVTGNLESGTVLTALVPVAGVSSAVVGEDGIAGGAEEESIAAWDARQQLRLQEPPQGGNDTDYRRWARDAHPAVTNVWVDSNGYGPGTVVVRFMTYGATSNGIPAEPVVDAVYDYISERRQVGMAGLYVLAPAPVPVDLTLASVTPNTEAVRNAIEAEIAALIVRSARTGATIPLSKFDEAASLADGEEDHAFAEDTEIPDCAAGEILVPGTITWE